MGQFPSERQVPYQPYPHAQQIGHVNLSIDRSGSLYAELAVSEFVREMTEKVMAMEESVLAGVVADELRRRGYTVIAPESETASAEGKPYARQGDLERHAEKQGCSYSDAWNYFRDEGYDMSRVDPWWRE